MPGNKTLFSFSARQKLLKASAVFFAVLAAFLLFPVRASANSSNAVQKRVLYISSYSFSWGSVPFQMDGLSEGLGDDYVVNYEFMDTKNTVYSDGYRQFYDLLKYKLATRDPYDAVVVCDDAALNFVELYKDELFPHIPIVFSGIDNVENGLKAAEDPLVTGVVEKVDYAANMQLAHHLMPKANRLVLILDDMENGIGIASQLKASSSVFSNYAVEYLNSSTYTKEEFCKILGSFDDSDIVFCISMGQRKGGGVYSEEERYAMIRDYADVPMFRFTQSGVGNGLLGGYIVDHEACCRLAGGMLREMVEDYVTPDVITDTPSIYYLDYQVMAQYGIKKSQLPKNVQSDALILHEPDSFIRRHAAGITVTLCLCLLAVCSILLAVRQKSYRQITAKNQQLAAAVSAADKASLAKSQFLSRMSHDMRTPMNGVLGLAALMRDETDLTVIRQDITQLEMSGKYLLQLINDTLDMSKIESGKLELRLAPIDSETVLSNVLTNAAIMAKAKGVRFTVHTHNVEHEKQISVMADAVRLEQIFMNILSNAVKFTPAGGTVELTMETVSLTDELVTDRYCIRDTGIGISPDFLPHIFEAFSQEGRSSTSRESGTGLGMSIVKQLVDLMNSEISIQSEPNKGTEITLLMRYPVSRTALPEAAAVPPQADYSVLRGLHVLLCEDHPLNAQIAIRLLEKKGVQVDHAENGQAGIERFAASPAGHYNAVLMDVRMPVMDGLTAAKAIRAMPRADAVSVPILAMTANAYDEDIRETTAAGMNAHLAKPVDPNRLYEALARYAKPAR